MASLGLNIMAPNGMDIYSGAGTHTGKWPAFVTIGSTVIAAYTDGGKWPTVIPTATAIEGGTLITANGNFTSIQVTSGAIACIREY